MPSLTNGWYFNIIMGWLAQSMEAKIDLVLDYYYVVTSSCLHASIDQPLLNIVKVYWHRNSQSFSILPWKFTIVQYTAIEIHNRLVYCHRNSQSFSILPWKFTIVQYTAIEIHNRSHSHPVIVGLHVWCGVAYSPVG